MKKRLKYVSVIIGVSASLLLSGCADMTHEELDKFLIRDGGNNKDLYVSYQMSKWNGDKSYTAHDASERHALEQEYLNIKNNPEFNEIMKANPDYRGYFDYINADDIASFEKLENTYKSVVLRRGNQLSYTDSAEDYNITSKLLANKWETTLPIIMRNYEDSKK